jgi:deoxyadenosine/deoxycytidine kinase
VLDMLEKNPDADIYILERSIFTDRYIFVEMLKDKFGPTRMKMYDMWWDMWYKLLPIKFNSWVYLDTSVEEAGRRICVRDRTEETGINPEYQAALQKTHLDFYNKLKEKGENTVIIDAGLMNLNFMDNPDILADISCKILID